MNRDERTRTQDRIQFPSVSLRELTGALTLTTEYSRMNRCIHVVDMRTTMRDRYKDWIVG